MLKMYSLTLISKGPPLVQYKWGLISLFSGTSCTVQVPEVENVKLQSVNNAIGVGVIK